MVECGRQSSQLELAKFTSSLRLDLEYWESANVRRWTKRPLSWSLARKIDRIRKLIKKHGEKIENLYYGQIGKNQTR